MRIIAFDLWGTLAYLKPGEDFGIAIARELGIEKEEYHDIAKEFWFKQNLSPEDFARILIEKTRKKDASIEYLIERISSPYGRHRLFPETRSTLERLNQTNELFLISDTSSLGKSMFYDLCISKFFTGLYFSCNEGLTKEEGLFSRAYNYIGAKPNEVLVVGDGIRADYQIPLNLGSRATLIDRNNSHPEVERIFNLEELK